MQINFCANHWPAILVNLASCLIVACFIPLASGQQTAPQASDEWVKIAPTGALAEFKMPKKPRYVERQFTPVAGRDPIKVKLHIAPSADGKVSYAFSYFDLAETPRGRGDIQRVLDGAVRGSLATVMGNLQETKEDEGRYPGRRFTYTFRQQDRQDVIHDFVVISRIVLIRGRQYQLSGVAEVGPREIVDGKIQLSAARTNSLLKFLNSFARVKPEPDLPPTPRPGRADD